MEKIAIVGAGLVGRAWAIVFARAGYPVMLYDTNPDTVVRSLETVESSLKDLAEFGLIAETPSVIRARMSIAKSLEEVLADAEYAQESTLENVDVKKKIFTDMDAIAAPNTILASSTSTFMTSTFATEVKGRHRCLVAHPVNPPYLIPLVEVSPAAFTAPDVAQRTYDLMLAVGQKPIMMKKETQGFILNRLQWALMAEAYRLVDDGYVGVEDLDMTLKDGLGLRWSFIGPFEVGDLNAPYQPMRQKPLGYWLSGMPLPRIKWGVPVRPINLSLPSHACAPSIPLSGDRAISNARRCRPLACIGGVLFRFSRVAPRSISERSIAPSYPFRKSSDRSGANNRRCHRAR